jgi:hypothetical protein
MNIKEMRLSLNNKSAGAVPDTAPDWVVRGIYEKVNGLPLTPIPAGLRAIKNGAELRSFVTQAKRAPAKIMENTPTADAEMERLRLRYRNLSL